MYYKYICPTCIHAIFSCAQEKIYFLSNGLLFAADTVELGTELFFAQPQQFLDLLDFCGELCVCGRRRRKKRVSVKL